MTSNAERIALTVRLACEDAKDRLGRELAAYNAEVALKNAFGNSRRWLGLADILANSARSYIDDLATKIRAIETGGQASEAYSDAVVSFLAHLDSKYDSEWANDAPWRQAKDAPPPHAWQSAKGHLDLAFRVQHTEFDQTTNEPAIVSNGDKGPQWKLFDESVNLVAWLLTSPRAPTDYSKSGARNLARMVGEGKIRCRAGSLQKITPSQTIYLDWSTRQGQAELRKITRHLAEAYVLGTQAAVAGERANTAKIIEQVRKSPNPVQRAMLKQADDAVKSAGRRPEEIFRSAIGLKHAFDDLSKLCSSDENGPWCVEKVDRETSSFVISYEGEKREAIDVVGLQFSYTDMWDALGEEPEGQSGAIDNSAKAVTSKVKAENECQNWLATEFAADAEMRRTKADFQRSALEKFQGRLSVRGFLRAWYAVAPQAGRSKPGRKS